MGEAQRQVIRELKDRLCKAPILAFPQFHPGAEFIVESAYSNTSVSAILSQTQDGKDRVIAYASKSTSLSEQQYSDCKKSCLSTTWAILHFKSYLGGHHAVVKTSHHPVTYLEGRKCQEGLSGRITKWSLILQGQSFEVKYAKNKNMKHVQGLAAMHDCSTLKDKDCDLEAESNHFKWSKEATVGVPIVYADGCAVTGENGDILAGAGVFWPNQEVESSDGYKLGKRTSQYAELAAAMISIMQAVQAELSSVVVCIDSEYVFKTFSEYLPRWKALGMVNSKGKQVKNADIIVALDSLVCKSGIDVFWKKVKGHSSHNGPDKEGNDEADRRACNGALYGEPWELCVNSDTPVRAVTPIVCRGPYQDNFQGGFKRSPRITYFV